MGLDVPIPLSALWDSLANLLTVTFNTPLEPGPVDANNWLFTANDDRRRVVSPVAAGSQINASSVFLLPLVEPDNIDYFPPPFDVRSASDLTPAAGFTDFPLTVV